MTSPHRSGTCCRANRTSLPAGRDGRTVRPPSRSLRAVDGRVRGAVVGPGLGYGAGRWGGELGVSASKTMRCAAATIGGSGYSLWSCRDDASRHAMLDFTGCQATTLRSSVDEHPPCRIRSVRPRVTGSPNDRPRATEAGSRPRVSIARRTRSGQCRTSAGRIQQRREEFERSRSLAPCRKPVRASL